MPPAPRTHETTIIRRYPHPLARVYRAWIMPEHLEDWFCPSDEMRLKVERFDLCAGGEYCFRFVAPNGDCPVVGKFLSVCPEQSLIFSWLPLEPHPDAGKDTLVSIFFRAIEPSLTEVEVRHTLFPDEPMCACHREGWNGTLDRLGRYL